LLRDSLPEWRAESCRQSMQRAFTTLRTDTSVAVVILVSRGPAYITGKGYGREAETGAPPVTLSAATNDPAALARSFERGLAEMSAGLISAGKRVIVVIDNPELGFAPSECLIGRPLGLRSLRSPCALDRAAAEVRMAGYRDIVERIRTRVAGVEVFDAPAVLCTPSRCEVQRNSRLLYFDDDHLSLDGSRLVAAKLNTMLRQRELVAIAPGAH
jgi:hypothetical protein